MLFFLAIWFIAPAFWYVLNKKKFLRRRTYVVLFLYFIIQSFLFFAFALAYTEDPESAPHFFGWFMLMGVVHVFCMMALSSPQEAVEDQVKTDFSENSQRDQLES